MTPPGKNTTAYRVLAYLARHNRATRTEISTALALHPLTVSGVVGAYGCLTETAGLYELPIQLRHAFNAAEPVAVPYHPPFKPLSLSSLPRPVKREGADDFRSWPSKHF